MKLSARDQIIVAAALIVVAAVAAVFTLVMPQVRQVAKLDGEIATAEADIAAAQGLLNQRQDAKLQAANTQSRLIMLANEMPDAPELPSLIIELQDTANDSGIDFTKMTPTPPTQSTGYSILALKLSVNGQWADIIEFSRRLTRLTRQIRVVNVTLSPQQDTSAAAATQDTEAEASEEETAGPMLVNAEVAIEAYMLASSNAASGTVPPPPATPAGQ